MKTLKLIFSTVILFVVLTAGANRTTESVKSSTSDEFNTVNQCGVSNAAIQRYLENCSHHHTVYWVQDIPGTCNSNAGIENCGTATVFVSNGIIVGHTDMSGICE